MEKPLVFTFLSEINADRRRNAAVLDAEVVAVFVAARVRNGLERDARLEAERKPENVFGEVSDFFGLGLARDESGSGVDEPQKLGHQSNAHVWQNDGRQIVLKESGNVTKCRL